MNAATHLRSIATHWADLREALASTGVTTWPPAGRMTDYQRALEEADADLAEAARRLALYRRQFLDHDPQQIGESRPPLSIPIFDTMRAVEAALGETADQVAAVVQRSPMPFAPAGWPAADRARRDQLARADAADPRRWRWTGHRRPAPYTALWLLARVQGGPGPFRPLPEREAALIAAVAREACARVETALDITARKTGLAHPCPDCDGQLEMHGGAGALPVAHCRSCGRTWSSPDVSAAA